VYRATAWGLSTGASPELFIAGVSAQADEVFTVRIENVSAKDALKLSNGKTEPVGVADAFEFKVTAKPGERLTIAAMFEQYNDPFYAPREEGIALFDASSKSVAGDITSQILLWDAGTEVNEEPGLGPNQAPLQPAPHTGPRERGVVRPISEVNDGFHYPSVAEVLRVTIAPGLMVKR
jgi:hypothetical protein